MTLTFLNGGAYYLIWGIGMFTALLTAFYMTRVYFLTFRGKERFPEGHHPHESPATMTIPLYVLAVMAVIGGYLGLPALLGHNAHLLNGFLGGHHGEHGAVTMHHVHEIEKNASFGLELGLIVFSIAIALLGVFAAWRLYAKHGLGGDTIIQKRLGKFYKYMQDKFYVDELYQKAIIDPFVFTGRSVIMAFDKWVIDGIVNGMGSLVLFLGDTLKMLQTGSVGNYAMMIMVGVVAILSYLIFL
jgi:NADH-quinone oxidoreductase subunit L